MKTIVVFEIFVNSKVVFLFFVSPVMSAEAIWVRLLARNIQTFIVYIAPLLSLDTYQAQTEAFRENYPSPTAW